MTLTPAEMLAALNHLGAHYDPDNVSTATSDEDRQPQDRIDADSDSDWLAGVAEDRAERQWRWFEW